MLQQINAAIFASTTYERHWSGTSIKLGLISIPKNRQLLDALIVYRCSSKEKAFEKVKHQGGLGDYL
jgi:hypothetical protein